MNNLTANQKSFIVLMEKSDEHAQRGFQLLITKPDPEVFFDSLKADGFFEPKKAPGPTPADEPGYVRIPYWAPLDYLKHLAQISGERNDLELAEKVMNVVREVSRFRDESGEAQDNYHTYRIFAEIIGLIPREVFLKEDLPMIPVWLNGKFDRSLVGTALSKGVISRFLESESRGDLEMACTILNYCTELKCGEDVPTKRRDSELVTVVDGYFLNKIIEKHAEKLGHKIGEIASFMFVERIKEAFKREERAMPSYMIRPAVEEHEQNRKWHETENCLVMGLREILVSWVSADPAGSREFIKDMLKNKNDMINRIGIFLLNERWTELNCLYGDLVGPDLFDSKNLHELYQLLKRRFIIFNDNYKQATLKAICELPLKNVGENPEQYRRYLMQNWLSAVNNQGYKPVDDLFDELNQDKEMGKLSDHPDFNFYMETGWGPGPSPYELDELLTFSENGTIVEKLNAFEQTDLWRGPNIKALVTTLENVVTSQPDTILGILPQFREAKRAYQYGIINGFKNLWNGSDYDKVTIDWDSAWVKLIDFFESLLGDQTFWSEKVNEQHDLTPTRDWIPPLIAELLKSGTLKDEKAYSPDLLPRTLDLIILLLDNLEIEDAVDRDPMLHAINSSRGKSLEALFIHALRACRVADKKIGKHEDTWADIVHVFNKEIEKCITGANHDFSTLSGCYLPNLNYLSKDWLYSRITQIFPFDLNENFRCAIAGLTYASAAKDLYQLLVSNEIIDKALSIELNNEQVRERILDRVALAYLWGDETLDSSRFTLLLAEDKINDLINICSFFKKVHKKGLSEKQIELIVNFWKWCVEWGEALSSQPTKLYSSLSKLSCVLHEIDKNSLKLMVAVAPYVSINHNADIFIEELDRLATMSPKEVCRILREVLNNYKPTYDYEDRLRGLLTKLAGTGLRTEVIEFSNSVRQLKGIEQLYNELTGV
ncbi:MAG: hypothetical protein KKD44_20055 [Proteobacteria bacterium]|nr:hypothetical protein [Pseudomonadota bacterium]